MTNSGDNDQRPWVSKSARFVAGFVVGLAYSAMLAYLGLLAAGAGHGTLFPYLLAGGVLGTGYFLWPLIAGSAAVGGDGVARLLAILLTLGNYIGSAVAIVFEKNMAGEMIGAGPISGSAVVLFLVGQFAVWTFVLRKKSI